MEYKVTGNIQHDGQAFTDGDTIELTPEQAAPLIEVGVLENPNAPEDKEPEKPRVKKAKKKKDDVPVVGGEPTDTGEPSVDGKDEGPKDAEDITPVVDGQDPSKDL